MWAALAAALLLAPGPDPAAQPSRIVFASARTAVSQLYSVQSSGEGLAQLTFGTGGWERPFPSPDGRFVAAFRGESDLWLMQADGSGARRIVPNAWGSISWSADSRRFVFGSLGAIWTAAVAGGRPRQITRGPGDSWPSLSPDGRSIAFVRGDVLVVRRNGREKFVLKDVSGAPTWSPDGKWIAIGFGSRPSLALVRPTGGAPRVLAGANYSCYFCRFPGPAWSPDSSRLAYRDDEGIHVVRRSGGRARLLVGSATQGVAWSPSGDAIAFVTTAAVGTVTLGGRARPLVPFQPDEAQPGVGWTSAPTGLLYQTPEETPSLVRVSARELQARVPIRQLSADGDRVAYWLCPHVLGAWRPGDAEQVPFGEAAVLACKRPPPTGLGAYVFDLALAGDRLAYLSEWAANGIHWWLVLTTLEGRTEGVEIAQSGNPRGRPSALADVVGGGSALVYGARTPWLTLSGPPESIWRLDGATPVQIASRPDDLRPLAVDAGRIVAGHADGTLELLDLDGHVLETFPVPALGAALSGDDLVVLVRGELRDYSASTGNLLHAWPLPDVPSSGHCRLESCEEFRLTLDDAASGLALYTLDGVVHLLRLRDGADTTIPGATAAELTDAGLFYAYEGEEPWPGRIRFVPFTELPL